VERKRARERRVKGKRKESHSHDAFEHKFDGFDGREREREERKGFKLFMNIRGEEEWSKLERERDRCRAKEQARTREK
jgi:hypothetical protein